MSGPAPKLTTTLDPERYTLLCASMGVLYEPPVRFVRAKGPKPGRPAYAVFNPRSRSITVFTEQRQYELDGLRHINSELVITLIHELRHAWQQQEHGRAWYAKNIREAERDAEHEGTRLAAHWRGVIRVSRKHHGSGMSRLAARTAAVRHSA